MNKRVKKLWVAALRSGKYRQAKGALKKRNGAHCCLGVLCDLYSKEKKDLSFVWEGDEYYFDNRTDAPSMSVRKWAGLDSNDEAVFTSVTGPNGRKLSLIDLNDEQGYTFEQIAEVIERDL